MTKIAIVGCTGKLGSAIMKNIISRTDVSLDYAIARTGNQFVGKSVSDIIRGNCTLSIIDDIESAADCDVFIDCTSAEAFMNNNYGKYLKMKKPLVIATTAFSSDDMEAIKKLAIEMPVFMSGNFSIALHDFIETLKFYARRISDDTDVQIIEYHHNQKQDAPSGTALMICNALVNANRRLSSEQIKICSVRGGCIFGEHEVIFANCKDEVITFKHQVSSREAFASGAIEAAVWTTKRKNGLYDMDDFCADVIL